MPTDMCKPHSSPRKFTFATEIITENYKQSSCRIVEPHPNRHINKIISESLKKRGQKDCESQRNRFYCGTVPLSNLKSHTHIISLTGLPEHGLNKDSNNTHVKVEVGKTRHINPTQQAADNYGILGVGETNVFPKKSTPIGYPILNGHLRQHTKK